MIKAGRGCRQKGFWCGMEKGVERTDVQRWGDYVRGTWLMLGNYNKVANEKKHTGTGRLLNVRGAGWLQCSENKPRISEISTQKTKEKRVKPKIHNGKKKKLLRKISKKNRGRGLGLEKKKGETVQGAGERKQKKKLTQKKERGECVVVDRGENLTFKGDARRITDPRPCYACKTRNLQFEGKKIPLWTDVHCCATRRQKRNLLKRSEVGGQGKRGAGGRGG